MPVKAVNGLVAHIIFPTVGRIMLNRKFACLPVPAGLNKLFELSAQCGSEA